MRSNSYKLKSPYRQTDLYFIIDSNDRMNHLNISIVFIYSIINLKMKGTEEEVFSLK